MRRILIVCLLGMGMLLPATTITAKEFIIKRTVNIYLEGDIVEITSDANSGSLTLVKVYNSSKVKVIEESCSGYEHDIDMSSFPSGLYSVVAYTTITTCSQNIYL